MIDDLRSKTWFKRTALALLLSTINHQLSTAFAQGSLTPPGAPAPTMKSLDQLEPRTPVDAAHTPGDAFSQFIINQPGSYYLTTNVFGASAKYGIEITTNNVVLDLNGFALLGTSNSYDGIVFFGQYSNLAVRNGTVSGWALGAGFVGIRSLGQNATFERLNISGNAFGIQCNGGNVIRDCVVNANQRDGITVQGAGSLVLNNNLAGNNALSGPGNAGLSIVGTNNRIEGNHVTGNGGGYGIVISLATSTNNIVVRNSVTGNGLNNYSSVSGNIIGPLINNTVSGIITNSNPWANFSF
jgi:hypothetical protein